MESKNEILQEIKKHNELLKKMVDKMESMDDSLRRIANYRKRGW
jgi:predicted ribonuclease toxin of YeeF-YezG toxin-antitoxin module